MTDLTVKYFNSGMTGVPQISNNWGDLVTMLDACLVNGLESQQDLRLRYAALFVPANAFSQPSGATLAERLVALVAGDTGAPVTA